jgi:hypothetical protein
MAKTARKSPSEPASLPDIEAVILTRNDPVRLNACLWSIFNQTLRPASVLLVNTGAWMTSEIGGTLDIISERVEVRVKRIRNGRLGDVHADCLRLAQRHLVWFFQDDAIAEPTCLEKLIAAPDCSARLPSIVYPDYEPMAGEAVELPQELAYVTRSGTAQSVNPLRGPCLGMLLYRQLARRIAPVIEGMPMGLDDALVQLAQPRLVPEAFIYHTRPEKPRWNRIVDMMKTEVLPRKILP